MRDLSRVALIAVAVLVPLTIAIALLLKRDGSPAVPSATSTPTDDTSPTLAPAPPFALAPTRRCLRAAGFTVTTIQSSDPRLRALADLAQRTSLEARRGRHALGLAFGDTRLLSSLLRVPNDPYRLEVRRNALLMYRSAARSEAAALRGCLRS